MVEPLDQDQTTMLHLVFSALTEDGQWPNFAWVESALDRQGLDAAAVLASFPVLVVHPVRHYSAVFAHYLGSPPAADSSVALTALGMWFVQTTARIQYDNFLKPFWLMLDCLYTIRRGHVPDRHQYALPEVTWAQLRETVGTPNDDVGKLLQRAQLSLLLADEPPGLLAHGTEGTSLDVWRGRVDRPTLRLGGIGKIEEYMARRLIGRPEPQAVAASPVIPSPLGLVAAMDYLDVVWRLAYGEKTGLFRHPNAEMTARLSHPVGTGEEFLAAISAAGDVVTQMDGHGESGSHPCDRLETRLKKSLSEDGFARAKDGVDVLRAVHNVRHSSSHGGVGLTVLGGWDRLGISYLPPDWGEAWDLVRARLVAAIDAIRGEVRLAEPPSAAASE